MAPDIKQTMVEQAEKMVKNDLGLIDLVNKMNPEDKKKFAPMVEQSIIRSQNILHSLQS